MLWNGLKTDTYDDYLLSFYCESNELGKLRCPEFCLLFSYVLFFLTSFFLISLCLMWFFPVSVFLILFCLTWFFPSGLRFSRIMVLVSGLCLKQNWLTASSKKIDIKNCKMHPWQRWLGGFVDCHAGWLTSLRNGNRFILIILIILIIFTTYIFSWPPSAMVWLRINLNVKGCCSIILKCSPTCNSLNMKRGEIREAQRGNKEVNFEEARAS